MDLVQSLSKAAQPPSRHWKVIIHRMARSRHSSRRFRSVLGVSRRARMTMAVSSTSGFHWLANSNTQPEASTSAGFLWIQSPRKRISLSINHSAERLSLG